VAESCHFKRYLGGWPTGAYQPDEIAIVGGKDLRRRHQVRRSPLRLVPPFDLARSRLDVFIGKGPGKCFIPGASNEACHVKQLTTTDP
jgi:hypothetical protein